MLSRTLFVVGSTFLASHQAYSGLTLDTPGVCSGNSQRHAQISDRKFIEFTRSNPENLCAKNKSADNDKFDARKTNFSSGAQQDNKVSACLGSYEKMKAISKSYLEKRAELDSQIKKTCEELALLDVNNQKDYLQKFGEKINIIAGYQEEIARLLKGADADLAAFEIATGNAVDSYKLDNETIIHAEQVYDFRADDSGKSAQKVPDLGSVAAIETSKWMPVATQTESGPTTPVLDGSSAVPIVKSNNPESDISMPSVVSAKSGGVNSLRAYSSIIGTLIHEQLTAKSKVSEFRSNANTMAGVYQNSAAAYRTQAAELNARASSMSGASQITKENLSLTQQTETKGAGGNENGTGGGKDSGGFDLSKLAAPAAALGAAALGGGKASGSSDKSSGAGASKIASSDLKNEKTSSGDSKTTVGAGSSVLSPTDVTNNKKDFAAAAYSYSGSGLTASSSKGKFSGASRLGKSLLGKLSASETKGGSSAGFGFTGAAAEAKAEKQDAIVASITGEATESHSGGVLGGSDFSLAGSETDSSVSDIMKQMAGLGGDLTEAQHTALNGALNTSSGGRSLASQGENVIQSADSSSLFDRNRNKLAERLRGGKILGPKNEL